MAWWCRRMKLYILLTSIDLDFFFHYYYTYIHSTYYYVIYLSLYSTQHCSTEPWSYCYAKRTSFRNILHIHFNPNHTLKTPHYCSCTLWLKSKTNCFLSTFFLFVFKTHLAFYSTLRSSRSRKSSLKRATSAIWRVKWAPSQSLKMCGDPAFKQTVYCGKAAEYGGDNLMKSLTTVRDGDGAVCASVASSHRG